MPSFSDVFVTEYLSGNSFFPHPKQDKDIAAKSRKAVNLDFLFVHFTPV